MGGIGSGRPAGFGRRVVEEVPTLDVAWLHRKGHLVPGTIRRVIWSCGDTPAGSVVVLTGDDRIVLSFMATVPGSAPERLTQTVGITLTRCGFGGTLPWFVCPGQGCGRRVGKLHAGGPRFLYRHCHRLVNASQREALHHRLDRQAHKLRGRLGAGNWPADLAPPRPKGMWRRTYLRLVARLTDLQEAFAAHAIRLLGRLEGRGRNESFRT